MNPAISPWVLGDPELSGVLLIAGHVMAVAAVIMTVILSASLGRWVLNGLGPREASPPEDDSSYDEVDGVTASVLIGAGTVATLLLLLAMSGALNRMTVLGSLVVLAVFRGRDLPETGQRLWAVLLHPVRSLPMGWPRWLGVSLAAAWFALTVPRALLPAVDWDSLMYHLPIPIAFLEGGGLVVPPDNLHSAYAGLPHLLATPFLALGLPQGVQLLALTFALVLGLSVWSTAGRWGGDWAATAALCTLLGSTMVALVAVTPRVDVTLAAWMWVGQAALLRLLFHGWNRRDASIAALVLGFAIGVKYHALAYGAVLAPVAIAAALRAGGGWARRIAIMGAGAGVLGAPWLAKNLLLFGSPLYPFGGERIVPPWLAERLGSAIHPESVGLDIYWLLREARAPFDLFTFLTDPARVSVEGEAAFFLMSPLLILAVAGLMGRGIRPGNDRWKFGMAMNTAIPALGFVLIILAVSPRTNPRYLIPALPAFAVLAGWGFGEVVRRLNAETRWMVGAGLLVLALIPLGQIAGSALDPRPGIRHALGLHSPTESLRARGGGAFLELRAHMSAELNPGERALMVGEARGLYLDTPTLQDNVLTNWPLLNATRPVDDCLAQSGISHIIVGRPSLDFYARRGMDLSPLRLDELERFLQVCGETTVRVGGWDVVELRREGEG